MNEVSLRGTVHGFSPAYGLVGNITDFQFNNNNKKKMILKLDFIAILGFRKPLAVQNVKCISLNDETWLVEPMVFDLN